MAELNAPEAVLRCQETNSESIQVPECISMNASEFGLVNSIFAAGGFIGALGPGSRASIYGRARLQLYNVVPLLLGGLILTFSVDVWSMALGRFLSGVGCGTAGVYVPLYIKEITAPSRQSVMSATTQISVNFGILLTQVLGLFWSDSTHWRHILAVGALIPVFQLLLAPTVQESPKWLLSRDQQDEAHQSLSKLRGARSASDVKEEWDSLIGVDQEGGVVESETLLHADTEHQPGGTKDQKIGFAQFLTEPEYHEQRNIVLGIMCIQQLSGINGIVMYGVAVLRDLFPSSSGLINVAISFINLTITAAAASFFGRVGRRPFIMASIGGMGTFAFLLGCGIIWNIPILSAISTVLFVSSFSIGLGPLPWSVASEVVPYRALGAAQSLALGANWIGTFVVSFCFPIIADFIGIGQTFWVFTCINAYSLYFVYKNLPETNGIDTPEEVWNRWYKGRSGWERTSLLGRLRAQDDQYSAI